MAHEEKAVNVQPAEAAAGRKGGGLIRILVIVGSLVGGSAAGALVVGPMLTPAVAAEGGAAEDGHGGSEAPPKKSKGGHGKSDASPLYHIESLVVNPSGTQGTRFVVLSIAVETTDSHVSDVLKDRDAEVRDVLVNLIASQSVDELADLNRREALKQAIGEQLDAIAGKGSVKRVFLPQFVLQ